MIFIVELWRRAVRRFSPSLSDLADAAARILVDSAALIGAGLIIYLVWVR